MKKNLSDILFCIGGLVICAGVFMLSIPIAIILSGGFIMLASYSVHKGGR